MSGPSRHVRSDGRREKVPAGLALWGTQPEQLSGGITAPLLLCMTRLSEWILQTVIKMVLTMPF